ncbi:MAG TPA: energy transducer TonB [Thermoanaerobaculia bacterium]
MATSAAVDRVLGERLRRTKGGEGIAASVVAAVVVHGAAVALALLLPRLAPPPKPFDYVPVDVIPAQALGVPNPAPRPRVEPKPAPAPPVPPQPQMKPAPQKPAPKAKEPEPPPKPTPQAPVLPIHEVRTKPQPPKPAPPTPPAPPPPQPRAVGNAAPDAAGDTTGRKGSLTGNPTSSAAFGSQVTGLDPDFTYGYYIDQLLSRIDSNWVRPPADNRVHAVVSFHIQRDGSLTGLEVRESSGNNAFDLAALRAVQNAAPFPPLPRAYVPSSLGVNLIVR